jgi:membrane protease YdiL (CAAX protease family)
MQEIDNKQLSSDLVERCDLLALLAGTMGFALRFGDFTHFLSTGTALFLLGILYVVVCSLFILGGYALGHRLTGVPWAELFPLRHCGAAKRLAGIIGVAFLLLVLVTVVNYVIVYGNPEAGTQYLVQYIQEADWLLRLRLLVETCVFAPICEEFFFRLALPRWLTARGVSENLADLSASLAFSCLHLVWWGIPGLFLFGITLCFLRRRQDILSCCCVHALYNLLVAVMAISFLKL